MVLVSGFDLSFKCKLSIIPLMAKQLLSPLYSFLLVFLLNLLMISFATGEVLISVDGSATVESFENGLVVSVDPIASEVGMEIIRKGGNAVDAAVATGFTLAVTHPSAGNIGGGGFMMVSLADTGKVHAVDYRERAPAGSTPTMFLGSDGEVDLEKSGSGIWSSVFRAPFAVSGKPANGLAQWSGPHWSNPL